jgi:hypothetical protein
MGLTGRSGRSWLPSVTSAVAGAARGWAAGGDRRTMGTMTRHADHDPGDRARREAIRDRLLSGGMDHDVAERWCDAWETEAALQGIDPGAGYWDAGKRWIDVQCAARRRPPD